MSFGWLYDGKNFLQPASEREAEHFEKHGYVDHGMAGCKPVRVRIAHRAVMPRTFGDKLPLPGDPGFRKST